MNTPQVIALLRRRVLGTDASASYADDELLQAVEDARSLLAAKLVLTMSTYTVDPTDILDGITPDMAADDAHIVTLRAACDVLSQRYSDLTHSGALGVVWKSGLEEESTVTAEKAYRIAIDRLKNELTALLLIRNRTTSATRPL